MSGSNDWDPCLSPAFNIGGSCERSSNSLPLVIGILLVFNPNVESLIFSFVFFVSLSLSLSLPFLRYKTDYAIC